MEQIKNFEQFNESNREKFFLNGFEMWLDRDKLLIFDKEDSKNDDGTHFYSPHFTKDERRQIYDYMKYNR